MQKCYTIYLGARNTPHRTITAADYKMIDKLVNEKSENYTLIRAKGYWRGKSEDSAIIVLALKNDDRHEDRIQECCAVLREEFGQDAVLCQMSGDAVLLHKGNARVKGNIRYTKANSARSAWAKQMLKQLRNQEVVKTLKKEHALSKLENLKTEKPQAEFPEALARLKKDFPHLAKHL
jgi:hypothetical protein